MAETAGNRYLLRSALCICSLSLSGFYPGLCYVVGTEATGLSETWLEHSTQNIIIPMQGAIDSMNVSVAAAIITFEAKRQRGFQS